MTLESLTRRDTLAERVAIEIRAALARRGQSQSALARALGEHPSWVSLRLTGGTQMTINDLARIADALALTVVDLLPRDERGVTIAYPPIGQNRQHHAGVRWLTGSRRPATRPVSGRTFAHFPIFGTPEAERMLKDCFA